MINHYELLEDIVKENLPCLILLVLLSQKYLELIYLILFLFRDGSIWMFLVLHGFS